jgi:hypothetical protein
MVVVSTLESNILIMQLRFLATLTQPRQSELESVSIREMTEASDLNVEST